MDWRNGLLIISLLERIDTIAIGFNGNLFRTFQYLVQQKNEQSCLVFPRNEKMAHTYGKSPVSATDVIVVGAGPVGLLTALKLCLAGVSVIVVEKFTSILDLPRAIAYLPVVNKELKKLGLAEEILKECHICASGPIWLNMDRTVLGAIGDDSPHKANGEADQDNQNADNLDKVTLMVGQDVLARIVLGALERKCGENFEVKFGTSVVGIQPLPREDGLVEVMTSTRGKNGLATETILTAKWVVGADGAGSFVRKACCIPFEGFAWDNFRFTAADIEYQFDVEGGYRPITYIADPEEWAVIARTGRHNVWRICYGERLDLPGDDAAVAERSKERIKRYLPGSKYYKLRRIKPYWAQQRCAKVFRKGRVVLVGDAAHVRFSILTRLGSETLLKVCRLTIRSVALD